jgi:4-hydroxybenzoate polyprenyltransferase
MSTLRRILSNFFILIKSRFEVILAWPWFTAFGYLVASQGSIEIKPFLLAVLSIVFLTLSTYIYNDLLDAPGDRLNPKKKQRPIAAGKVQKTDARIFITATGISGLVLLFFLNVYSVIFGLLYYILFTLYSYRGVYLKRRFLLKELSISLAFPLTSLTGIFATGSFSLSAFIISVIVGIYAFLSQPILADASDMHEDKLSGIKNIARMTTWKTKKFLMLTAGILFFAAVPVIYLFFDFKIIFLYLSVLISFFYLIFIMISLQKIKENLLKTRHLSHAYVLLIQLFFVIAAF